MLTLRLDCAMQLRRRGNNAPPIARDDPLAFMARLRIVRMMSSGSGRIAIGVLYAEVPLQ